MRFAPLKKDKPGWSSLLCGPQRRGVAAAAPAARCALVFAAALLLVLIPIMGSICSSARNGEGELARRLRLRTETIVRKNENLLRELNARIGSEYAAALAGGDEIAVREADLERRKLELDQREAQMMSKSVAPLPSPLAPMPQPVPPPPPPQSSSGQPPPLPPPPQQQQQQHAAAPADGHLVRSKTARSLARIKSYVTEQGLPLEVKEVRDGSRTFITWDGVIVDWILDESSEYFVRAVFHHVLRTGRGSDRGLCGDGGDDGKGNDDGLGSSTAPPPMILDIGANAGYFGLLALAHCPCCLTVFFEPQPECSMRIATGLVLNGWNSRGVIVQRPVAPGPTQRIPVPVSGCSGTFGVPEDKNDGDDEHGAKASSSAGKAEASSVMCRTAKGFRPCGTVAVPTISVQKAVPDVLQDPGTVWAGDRSRVELIKIDVEGAELSILRDLWPTLEQAGRVGHVVVELTPSWWEGHGWALQDGADLLYDIVAKLGFTAKIMGVSEPHGYGSCPGKAKTTRVAKGDKNRPTRKDRERKASLTECAVEELSADDLRDWILSHASSASWAQRRQRDVWFAREEVGVAAKE